MRLKMSIAKNNNIFGHRNDNNNIFHVNAIHSDIHSVFPYNYMSHNLHLYHFNSFNVLVRLINLAFFNTSSICSSDKFFNGLF